MAADPWDQFQDAPSAAPVVSGANDEWSQFKDAVPSAPAPQRPTGDLVDAVNEGAMSLGSAALATPVAGLAGLGAIATNAAGWTNVLPESIIQKVQEALTYRPRTRAGEVATAAVSYPFEKLAQGADWAGQKVLDVTGSPVAATMVNTAIQAAPSALAPVMRRGQAVGAAPLELAPDTPVAPPVSQPIAQPAVAPAPKAAPADLAYVAPDLVLEQNTRASKPAPKADPETRAKEYVRSNGVDWAALPRQTQEVLLNVAKDARGFEGIDGAALQRQLQLQSLAKPVPATRGQLTRDPVQLRNEGNVSATNAGKAIRDIHLDANQALLDNLDLLKGRVANKTNAAQTPEQVGLSVQDEALRAKYQLKKDETSRLYKEAEAAGDLEAPVSPARLIQTIRGTPDKVHFGWVESWLNDMNVVSKDAQGNTVTKKLKLKELEDLRQAAVARAMDGGTEGYYAGKIISAIDSTTEGVGGAAYKKARASRRAQALEFEETGAIAKLVDNKSRTDRAVALEDTWRKTVLGGSLEDIRNVKRSLLTGGDRKTRAAGKRAWRDIKAQTIQHIKDEATKGVARNERGQADITPAAMKRAIDSIGPQKLDEVFGPGTARRLNNILEATRTVKTEPAPIHKGSSTMGNILAFLERGLGSIPFAGDAITGTVRAGMQLKQMGEAGRLAKEAQRTPLDDAAKQAKKRNALADF